MTCSWQRDLKSNTDMDIDTLEGFLDAGLMGGAKGQKMGEGVVTLAKVVVRYP